MGNDIHSEQIPYLLFVRICGLLAWGAGVLALIGWWLKLPNLASLASGYIPMAPSTALLFVLLGVSVLLRTLFPLHRRVYESVLFVNISTALLALLLLVLSLKGIHPALELLGFSSLGVFNKAPSGYMSPVTAFCFMLSSLSYLISFIASDSEFRRKIVALFLAATVFLINGALALAYLYGAPLLYGSSYIPVSAITNLTFIALGIALLILAVPHTWLVQGRKETISLTSKILLIIFAIFSAGIVSIGYYYCRNYEKTYRNQVERQLAAIAELKINQLVQWRRERLGDAAVIDLNPAFFGLVQRFLENRNDTIAKEQILGWLRKYIDYLDYNQVRLFDAQGNIRLTLPTGQQPVSTTVLRQIPLVMQSGQVMLLDFYQHDHDKRIYLSVLVPILSEKGGKKAIGVLALRVDPETYLYPLLKKWPTDSRTAETLLVRREGNEVVFLNELRFKRNTALVYRVPLVAPNLPAAEAVRGATGIIEGIDYRGSPVIASVQAVPDSPWFLLARMDTAEVNPVLLEKLWLLLALVSALLFGGGTSVGLIWRHRHLQHYKEKSRFANSLQESEKKYRDFFDYAGDAIFVLGINGKMLDVNQIACDRLGYSREELLQMTPADFNSPENAELVSERIQQLMVNKHQIFETVHVQKDGGLIPSEISRRLVEYNGWPAILSSARDITERKQSEKFFKDLMQRFQLAIKSASIGIWDWDVTTNTMIWDERMIELYGLTLETFPGGIEAWQNGLHPENRDRIIEECQAALRGEIEWNTTFKILHPDGTVKHIRANGIVIRNSEGAPIRMLGVNRDISDFWRAEEARRESESNFRNLFENATSGVALHDIILDEHGCPVDYIFRQANKAFETHTGIKVADIIGKRATEIFPGIEISGLIQSYDKVASTGESTSFELYFKAMQRHYHISAYQISKGRFAVVFENITERILREAEIKQKNAELERFTYTVSHDLRSPLVTVKAFLGFLEQDIAVADAGRVEKDIRYMHAAANKMEQLLDDLMEMCRLGCVINDPVCVTFRELADEAIAAVAGSIAAKKVALQVDTVDIALIGDRPRLAEIWQNLIENSVKYMGDQKAPRIDIAAELYDGETVFSVRDNGMGIDPRHKEMVFGLFNKLDPKSEGSGFGLALVKRIVELYKGKIWLESEGPGKGSCFRFTLPGAVEE